MDVTHSIEARQAAADALLALVDGGDLVILDSADVVLARAALSATAAGATDGSGIATFNAIADSTVLVDGTAAKCEFQNSAGAARIFGNVTATGGGGVVELVTTQLVTGQVVDITSATYEALP